MSRSSSVGFTLLALLTLWSPFPHAADGTRWTIGFSQATTTEPWRLLFNQELRAEAARHPNVDLVVRDGLDDVAKQVADMEELIAREVDAILISPKVAAGLTPVVNRAHRLGIPVIVLDRDLVNRDYTQFIGGDNRLIGRTAGEYAVRQLGGPGNATGNIIEIWGGMKSTPAQDRHSGFAEVVKNEPGIRSLLSPEDGDWNRISPTRSWLAPSSDSTTSTSSTPTTIRWHMAPTSRRRTWGVPRTSCS